MRVLICGGGGVGRAPAGPGAGIGKSGPALDIAARQRRFVFETLDKLHKDMTFDTVICGVEGGSERLGLQWAELRGVPTQPFRRRSGWLSSESLEERNMRMLKEGRPDLCVAFAGGEGTERLLKEAAALGVKILRQTLPE